MVFVGRHRPHFFIDKQASQKRLLRPNLAQPQPNIFV